VAHWVRRRAQARVAVGAGALHELGADVAVLLRELVVGPVLRDGGVLELLRADRAAVRQGGRGGGGAAPLAATAATAAAAAALAQHEPLLRHLALRDGRQLRRRQGRQVHTHGLALAEAAHHARELIHLLLRARHQHDGRRAARQQRVHHADGVLVVQHRLELLAHAHQQHAVGLCVEAVGEALELGRALRPAAAARELLGDLQQLVQV
jgi:hypothetical protein